VDGCPDNPAYGQLEGQGGADEGGYGRRDPAEVAGMAATHEQRVDGQGQDQRRLPGDHEARPALQAAPLLGGFRPAQALQQDARIGEVLDGEADQEERRAGGEVDQALAEWVRRQRVQTRARTSRPPISTRPI
jgi:hypothetical protein